MSTPARVFCRLPAPGKRAPFFLLLTVATGLLAAGVLSMGHWLDLPVPCGRSSGCATVAAHPSSKPFGVPIAYLGVLAYFSLLLLLTRLHRGRLPRALLAGIAGTGTAVSAVLLAYAHWVIGANCAWCVISGVSMLLTFLLALGLLPRSREMSRARPAVVWGAAGAVVCAVALQGVRMQSAALVTAVDPAALAAMPEHELTAAGQSLGPVDAPVTVVAFTDLWCGACRSVHRSLLDYQAANPTGVRLVYRHLPLWEIRGHESSGIAAGLAEMAGEAGKFWEFVSLLFSLEAPPSKQGYLELMAALGFDRAVVERRFDDPGDPAIARVQQDMALASRLEIDATPTFFVIAGSNPPVAANPRTLPDVLNAPGVRFLLARHEQQLERTAAGDRR